MKYIKQYENKNIKHILIEGSSGDNVFLLSIIRETENKYFGIINYIFKKENDYIKEKYNTKENNYIKNVIDNNKLFKSDNIEDCFKFMEVYAKTNKYNL